MEALDVLKLEAKRQRRNYYLKNRERFLSRAAVYRETDREKRRLRSKKYRLLNKEKIVAHRKEYLISNKEKLQEYSKQYRKKDLSRFVNATKRAKRRGMLWAIEFDDYKWLISLSCFYCDGALGKVMTGAGLDRIDNSQGYTLQNVVSCCNTCNTIKHDKLSLEETQGAIVAILKFREVLSAA